MSEIIKVCKKHGPLKANSCYFIKVKKRNYRFDIRCKECSSNNHKKRYRENEEYREKMKKKSIEYNKKNKESHKISWLKWLSKNKDSLWVKNKIYGRNQTKELSDGYVKKQLKRQLKIQRLPEELLQLKRVQIRLKRELIKRGAKNESRNAKN